MHRINRLIYLVTVLFSHSVFTQEEEAAVIATLDDYHRAAASADWDTYFDLMSIDSVFIGTDASERWEKIEFEAFARTTKGWTYTPGTRNINFTPLGNVAWFDESLSSESYGTCRGTGVLIRTDAGWKISQYHLTFPIPNPLVGEIIQQIKAFENP